MRLPARVAVRLARLFSMGGQQRNASDAKPADQRQPFRIDPALIEAIAETQGANRRPAPMPAMPTFDAIPMPMPGIVPEGEYVLAADNNVNSFISACGGFDWVNRSGIGFLGYPFLSELAQRQEYRLISQVFAEEMTREWIEWEITDDKTDEKKKKKIKEIEEDFRKFGIKKKFHEAIMLEGLMGIGHLYYNIEGARDDQELLRTPLIFDPRNIKKGQFKGLTRVEPVWVYPATYNSIDPLNDNFFRPQSWWVMGKEVHKSRMISMAFREVPDLIKPIYMFGGISMTQLCMPAVQNWLETRSSVNQLIDAFSTMVFATNLGVLMAPGMQNSLIARVTMFNNMRNNRGSFVIDKENEDLKNVSAPLSGLDQLQAQALEHIAALARQPLVKFTGLQPAGLNASSDGEIRTFYDTIAALQDLLMPALVDCNKVVQINRYGEYDPTISPKFRSLWQLDEAGQRAADKEEADTFEVLTNIGAVDGSEVRQVLSLKTEGVFRGVDLSKPLPMTMGFEDEDENAKAVNDPIAQHIGRQSIEAGGMGGHGAASGV